MGVTRPGGSGDCWRTRAGSGSCGHHDVRRAGVYQGLDSLLSSPYTCWVSLVKFSDRSASAQLWRRVCAETTLELQLLLEKWQLLLAGLVFQVSFPIDLG